MKYNVEPVFFVSVESGHSFGPPMQAETEPMDPKIVLDKEPDTTKDVVVVTLEDAARCAGIELGFRSEKPMRPFALHPVDARNLCIGLMCHLASMGDVIARDLLVALQEILSKHPELRDKPKRPQEENEYGKGEEEAG